MYPTEPASFRPCHFHLKPAGSDRLVARRFQSVQCVNVPPDASGSTASNAKERVDRGGAVQRSGGERFAPAQVYRAGMRAPEWKAGLTKARTAARMCTAGI